MYELFEDCIKTALLEMRPVGMGVDLDMLVLVSLRHLAGATSFQSIASESNGHSIRLCLVGVD